MPYREFEEDEMETKDRRPLSVWLKGLIFIAFIFLIIIGIFIVVNNSRERLPSFDKNDIYIYSVSFDEDYSKEAKVDDQKTEIKEEKKIDFKIKLSDKQESTVCYKVSIFNGTGNPASYTGVTASINNESSPIIYSIEDKDGNEMKIGSILAHNSHMDFYVRFYYKDEPTNNVTNCLVTFNFNIITDQTNTITFDSNGGSEVGEIVVPSGMSIRNLPVSFYSETDYSAYILDGWYYGDEKLTTETIINEDITCVARWKPAEIYYMYKLDGIGINAEAKRFKRTTEEAPLNCTDATNTYYGSENDIVTWYDESTKTQYYRTKDGSMDSIIRLYSDSEYAFLNKTNIEEIDTTNWSFYNINSLKGFFKNCKNLKTIDVSHFNVKDIYNFDELFYGCSSLNKIDISNWNTSSASSIIRMFANCKILKEIDLTNLNTSNCNNFSELFADDVNLTTIDGLNALNVSSVGNMQKLFYNCKSLKKADLGDWNTSNVYDLSFAFMNCVNLHTVVLTNWNTENVATMESMFAQCNSIKEIDISSFVGSKVENLDSMFINCINLKSIDMTNFSTPRLYTMKSMFENDKVLKSIEGLNIINVSNVDSLLNVFHSCDSISELNIGEWQISNVHDLEATFSGCSSLTYLNLENWDFSNVNNMKQTFMDCSKLTEFAENEVIWNLSNVINMDETFKGAKSLKSLDKVGISEWNTSNVESMNETFRNCKDLKADCSRWNVGKVLEHNYFNNSAPYVTLPEFNQ